LVIAKEGLYTFHLSSDDGSKMWINGRLVVDNDGLHAPMAKSGKVQLPRGKTPVTVAVFNAGGGFELDVTMEGPGLAAQPLALFLEASGKAVRPKAKAPPAEDFTADAGLAGKGRALFATPGCA